METYIPGRELSVAVLEGKALGVLELCPSHDFYDYDSKYTDGLTQHIMPADLSDFDRNSILGLTEKAVLALGLAGVSRVDFRFDESKVAGARAFVLEANTLPGMTPLSIVPEIAAYAGIHYKDLCRFIIEHPISILKTPVLKGTC